MAKRRSQDVVEKDQGTVRFAARTKVLTVETLRVRFPMSRSTAFYRLGLLCDAGYLSRQHDHGRGTFFMATRSGIAWAELDLAPPQFSLATLSHDLALARLVARIEAAGYVCKTEREMRLHQRCEEDGRYVVKMRDRGKTVGHFPDISFENPKTGTYIAIEVELSQKARARRLAVLRGFNLRLDSKGLGGVLYLTGTNCNANQLDVISRQLGLERGFACVPFDDELPADALRRLLKLEAERVH